MRDYEIDEAIESIMSDMDYYDYALEGFSAVGYAVGGILGNVSAELTILRRDTKRIPQLTDKAIKSKDPKKIKKAITIIRNDMEMIDEATTNAMKKSFSKAYDREATSFKVVAKECLPKLQKALKQTGVDWEYTSASEPKNPTIRRLRNVTQGAIDSRDPKRIRATIKLLERYQESSNPADVKKAAKLCTVMLEKFL